MAMSVLVLFYACGGKANSSKVAIKGAVVSSANEVNSKIYADSPALSAVPQISIVGEMGKSAGSSDCSFVDLTLIKVSEIVGGDGNQFSVLSVSKDDTCWAAVYWNFETPYTDIQSSLRFSVKSAPGGPTSIKAKIETAGSGGARESEEISKSFPADNNWHEITFPISEFKANSIDWRGNNYNLEEGIFSVVIALDDTDGNIKNGIGSQKISLDEVLFIK